MDETQDPIKVHEQMCGVTAERHMHKPSINDQHDQEELLVSTSTTGGTQDENGDRLLCENKTASNWDNMKGSGPFADLMAQMRSSDREVAMEEVMGAMMPMPEMKEDNTKEAPTCT